MERSGASASADAEAPLFAAGAAGRPAHVAGSVGGAAVSTCAGPVVRFPSDTRLRFEDRQAAIGRRREEIRMAGVGDEQVADMQAEVVVVGGGGAGLSAAITALERGCSSVIVLEKAGSPGGSTAMAHDIFAIESPVQKRAWFHTSKDEIFKAHMDWTHWTVDPRIVRAFIDRSGDTIAWLEAMGMRLRAPAHVPQPVSPHPPRLEGPGRGAVPPAAPAG